jgi:hypothetical protein
VYGTTIQEITASASVPFKHEFVSLSDGNICLTANRMSDAAHPIEVVSTAVEFLLNDSNRTEFDFDVCGISLLRNSKNIDGVIYRKVCGRHQ